LTLNQVNLSSWRENRKKIELKEKKSGKTEKLKKKFEEKGKQKKKRNKKRKVEGKMKMKNEK